MAYIGREPQIGNYQICDAISVVNGQAAYTMQVSSVNVIPESVNHMIVSLNGVIQKPGSSYTISSSTITFSSNLATGDSIDFIYLLGNVLDLGTPSDDTVTGAKIVDNAINSEHYTDGSIDTAHIAADQITKAKLADEVDIFAGTSLTAADLGSGIHIKTGDSGQGTAQGEADELVIEGSANAGINILSGSTSLGMISFGDSGDANIGFIHYNHNINAMTFRTNTSDTMIIDSAGHVTKPLQPAVHAYSSSAQDDIANGIVTIQLDAEVYDVNADFNTSNYTFTAPVTGKYLVSSNVDLTDIDTATQWLYGGLIVTSNRNYYASLIDPRSMHADSNQSFSSSTLVDMDANDTLVLKIRSSAHGAAQMNVTVNETYMTIVLSC